MFSDCRTHCCIFFGRNGFETFKKICAFRHTRLLDIKAYCTYHYAMSSPKKDDSPPLRLCKRCNAMVSNDLFKPGSKRKLCYAHLKEEHRHHVLGTLDRRAFNSIRSRSFKDLTLFKQTFLKISRKELLTLLTPKQLANYRNWCIVPKDPNQPISIHNVAVISSRQRRYLICNWKFKRDPDQYTRDLSQLAAN